MGRPTGFEPATSGTTSEWSTTVPSVSDRFTPVRPAVYPLQLALIGPFQVQVNLGAPVLAFVVERALGRSFSRRKSKKLAGNIVS